MANRHLSRSIVLQTLFEWDFSPNKDNDFNLVLERNIEEFGPGLNDDEYMRDLFSSVLKKKAILDEIIEKSAPDWPIDKISVIDRNILRLGLCELLFSDRKEVPPKVAINEAIELGKSFGGETSSRFINGVLGGVYKELGEPGKDDVSTKKRKPLETDPNKFPIEKKGGAVIYSINEGEIYLAFVHDVFGYWTLSKGGIDKDKTEEEGTKIEIKKELGIDVEIKELLGRNEYVATHPEKGRIKKQVVFFLAESEYKELELLNKSGGLDDVKWFKLSEISDLKMYENMIPLLTKAIEILTKE